MVRLELRHRDDQSASSTDTGRASRVESYEPAAEPHPPHVVVVQIDERVPTRLSRSNRPVAVSRYPYPGDARALRRRPRLRARARRRLRSAPATTPGRYRSLDREELHEFRLQQDALAANLQLQQLQPWEMISTRSAWYLVRAKDSDLRRRRVRELRGSRSAVARPGAGQRGTGAGMGGRGAKQASSEGSDTKSSNPWLLAVSAYSPSAVTCRSVRERRSASTSTGERHPRARGFADHAGQILVSEAPPSAQWSVRSPRY